MTTEFNPQFKKIGEILIHERKISEADLEKTLSSQRNSNDKLGTLLIKAGYITEDELIQVYSMQLGYKSVSEDELFKADPEAVRLIPEDFAIQNRMLAIRKNESSLVVAMEDPENLIGIDALKRHTDLNPEIYVAPPSALAKNRL